MFYTFWFYLKETRPHTCIHEHMYMHEHAHTHIHTHTQWSPKKTLVKKKRIHNRKRRHLESRNPKLRAKSGGHESSQNELANYFFFVSLSLSLLPFLLSMFPSFFSFHLKSFLLWTAFGSILGALQVSLHEHNKTNLSQIWKWNKVLFQKGCKRDTGYSLMIFSFRFFPIFETFARVPESKRRLLMACPSLFCPKPCSWGN